MRSPTSILIFLAILHQVIILQFANAQDQHNMAMIDEDGQIIRHDGPMMQKYMYPPMNVPRTETRQGTQKLTRKKCKKPKHNLHDTYEQRPPHHQAYVQVSRTPPVQVDKMSEILRRLSNFLGKLKHIWKVVVSILKVVFKMIFGQ